MTRNQKMAIEIMQMLDSKAEAQRRFDEIKSIIEEMKANAN